MPVLSELLASLRLPVIAAPMYIISTPRLVVEQCKGGIIGSFPALNARPASQLDEWLAEITETLAACGGKAAPFAVNLIVHKSNPRVDDDLALCIKYKVPLVITSLGARQEINDAVHSYGGHVLHDVINQAHARKAIEKNADGLIAVAAGAGGHGGNKSPFALVNEIRSWFEGTLALSGAIANGRSILAARAMGADLAYIGSAFIATEEAAAKPAYKQMVIDCTSDDIVNTNLFTGVHGNYLRPSILAAGYDPDRLSDYAAEKIDTSGKGQAWRDIWGCGQGIAEIKSVVASHALISRLFGEYNEARQRLCLG